MSLLPTLLWALAQPPVFGAWFLQDYQNNLVEFIGFFLGSSFYITKKHTLAICQSIIYIFWQLLNHTLYPEVIFLIQGTNELTLVYKPGNLRSAQPKPWLTTPIWVNGNVKVNASLRCIRVLCQDRHKRRSPQTTTRVLLLDSITHYNSSTTTTTIIISMLLPFNMYGMIDILVEDTL